MDTPNSSPAYDAFISYSHADLEVVLDVAEFLAAQGIQLFLDVWEMVPNRLQVNHFINMGFGLETLDDLLEALSRSSAAVLFHSAKGGSSWVRVERLLARIRQKKDDRFLCFDVHLDQAGNLSLPDHNPAVSGSAVCEHLASSLGKIARKEPDVIKRPPSREEIYEFQASFGEVADFEFYDVTPAGDLVLLHASGYLRMMGDIRKQYLDLVEWESSTLQFRRRPLFSAESTSSHDHSSGLDQYTDNKIELMSMCGDVLSFRFRHREEEENEWTGHHEVLEDSLRDCEYDTRQRVWLRSPSG